MICPAKAGQNSAEIHFGRVWITKDEAASAADALILAACCGVMIPGTRCRIGISTRTRQLVEDVRGPHRPACIHNAQYRQRALPAA